MIKAIQKKATESNKTDLISEKASFSKTQLAQKIYACVARDILDTIYFGIIIQRRSKIDAGIVQMFKRSLR